MKLFIINSQIRAS